VLFLCEAKMNSKKIKFHHLVPTNFQHQTKEFFSNSTLHGVRYIAEKGRSFGEKFMWFCFVAIGAVAAFIIIGSLWEKFQTNPTITGIELLFPRTLTF
jgi:acid-sensing ion channel, other